MFPSNRIYLEELCVIVIAHQRDQAAHKALGDLGALEEGGWVPISDETLVAVVQSENRDKACTSYVLPLLEAIGWVELERKRPARARQTAQPKDE